VKLRLLMKSQAPILMMTGWLNAASAVKIWSNQKRIPAGFLGIIMILAEIMAFGSDLLVSGSSNQQRCPDGVYSVQAS